MGLIGRVWAEIGGDSSGLKKAAKEAEDALNNLGKKTQSFADQQAALEKKGLLGGLLTRQNEEQVNKTGDAIKKVTGYVKGLVSVAAIYKGLKWMKDATYDAIDYADEVRNISRVTGASAEESSRLIQVTDSLGITTSVLTSSLQTMVKKGYQPTIESLMELSTQYRALTDPMEKALFLQNRFTQGTQGGGAGMGPLLELGPDKIQAMSASVNKMLVLNEQQLYQARLDALTVARYEQVYEGIKTKVGIGLLKTAYRAGTPGETIITDLQEYAQELKNIDTPQKEFNVLMAQSAKDMGLYIDKYGTLIGGLGKRMVFQEGFLKQAWATKENADAIGMLTDAEIELKNKEMEADAAVRISVGSMILKNSITSDGTSINQDYSSKMAELKEQELEFQATIDYGNKRGWTERNKKMREAAEGLAKVRDAQGKLTVQYKQQLGISAFDLVSAGMKDATPKALFDVSYAMGIVDEKTYGLQSAFYDTMDSLDGFTDGIINADMSLAGNIAKVKQATDVYQELSANTPEGWTVESYYNIFETTYHNDVYGGGYVGGKSYVENLAEGYRIASRLQHGGVVYGGAHGMMVPPGYSNDGMPVMVSSGERLDVTPAGNKTTGDDELHMMIADLKFTLEGLPIYIRDAIQTA